MGLGHTKVKADFDGHCVYNFFSYQKIGLFRVVPGLKVHFERRFLSSEKILVFHVDQHVQSRCLKAERGEEICSLLLSSFLLAEARSKSSSSLPGNIFHLNGGDKTFHSRISPTQTTTTFPQQSLDKCFQPYGCNLHNWNHEGKVPQKHQWNLKGPEPSKSKMTIFW